MRGAKLVGASRHEFTGTPGALAALRQLARPKPAAAEICEFCSVELALGHRHLLEVAVRNIVCVCDPCALRFENVVGGRWKLIPRDARALPDFRVGDAQWDMLGLPINLTFIYRSTTAGKVVALYPSPAGATESLVPVANWEELAAANPILRGMEADVEALLVKRLKLPYEYYLAPLDLCFELVGRIRLHWRGFSGGDKVWQEVDDFFARLKERTQSWKPTKPEEIHG